MSPDGPVRVLFVCTGNSARSQMAEALLLRAGGRAFVAASAGTHPRGVHPDTVRVLAEVGIDWSGARSTPLVDVLGSHWDRVVTVCDRARQACPVFPGHPQMRHWDLEDPAEVDGDRSERLAAFRRTRDEIARRVGELIADDTAERAGRQASSSRRT